jgi:hypothetical protein
MKRPTITRVELHTIQLYQHYSLFMHNKLQYTWRGDYCECVRPAQHHVLTWGSSSVPPGTTFTTRSPPGSRRIQQSLLMKEPVGEELQASLRQSCKSRNIKCQHSRNRNQTQLFTRLTETRLHTCHSQHSRYLSSFQHPPPANSNTSSSELRTTYVFGPSLFCTFWFQLPTRYLPSLWLSKEHVTSPNMWNCYTACTHVPYGHVCVCVCLSMYVRLGVYVGLCT